MAGALIQQNSENGTRETPCDHRGCSSEWDQYRVWVCRDSQRRPIDSQERPCVLWAVDSVFTRSLEASGTIVTGQSLNKKQTVITDLYSLCKARGDLDFNNEEVRAASARVGFGNPFDATKLDNSGALPKALVDDDVFIVHLGRGRHRFVSGIAIGYHAFESIPEERRYQWPYRRSLLNNVNTSESNILSVAYNQRIIHDFLYEDIAASPKVYSSNRTHIPLDYHIGGDEINVSRVQVEIDFTAEYQGAVTVFEAKNGDPTDFNVFQLFNPFRYYSGLGAAKDIPIVNINGCYLLRQGDRIRLYLYSFDDPRDPGSIQLLHNAEYTLVLR